MNERLTAMTRRFFLSTAWIAALPLSAAEWEELPRLPEPNGGFVCGAAGKKIAIAGGTNWEGGTKNWLRSVHEYDPAAKKWEKAKNLEKPVAYAVAMRRLSFSGKPQLSFVGGSDGKQPLRFITTLAGAKTVMEPAADLPSSLALAAGGTIGLKMIIAGGTDDAANLEGLQRSCHSIDFINGAAKVTKLAEFPGKPFGTAASAVIGSELFIFGGANWDEATKTVLNASEAHAYSVETKAWRKLKPLPFAVRGLTGVAIDDHRICLAGGYKSNPDGFTDEALIYDVKTNSYSSAKKLPYAAMVGLVELNGFVYCLGGEDKMKSRTDKFFRIAAADLGR